MFTFEIIVPGTSPANILLIPESQICVRHPPPPPGYSPVRGTCTRQIDSHVSFFKGGLIKNVCAGQQNLNYGMAGDPLTHPHHSEKRQGYRVYRV